MALRLLAHFYDRNEALIATGALEAAGIVVFIENAAMVSINPLHEIALAGFRLMVPEQELPDAIAIIEEARRTRSFEGERLSQRTYIALSMILMALMGTFLPFRTSKWHHVSEAGAAPRDRV
jgi:hypothetical protein